MDKKFILYLVLLSACIIATFLSVMNTREASKSSLSQEQIELLTDTDYFDYDTDQERLVPLFDDKYPLSLKELAKTEEPSPQLATAYDKFLNNGETNTLPILSFSLFVVTGVLVGFIIVTYILPRVVQRASEEVYGSSQKSDGPGPLSQAQSAVAQGEWAEAVDHYRQAGEEDPENRLPWIEIAMIQREKLEEPLTALATLDEALARGGWRENDETFFIFRKIDIHEQDLNQHTEAVALLRDVVARFPQTRHSANAMHKLHELGES